MGFETLTGMRVRQGQELLRQGQESPMVYRVMEGRLGVYRDADGGRVKLYDIEDGGIAGATSVILGRKQVFTVLGDGILTIVKAYRSEDLEKAYAEDDAIFPLLVTALLNEWRFLDRRLVDHRIASIADAAERRAHLAATLAALQTDVTAALARVEDAAFLRTALLDLVNNIVESAADPSPGALVDNLLWLKVNVTKAAVLRTISGLKDPAERRGAMTEILRNLARATVELSEQA